MLETIIIILVILWLLGAVGWRGRGRARRRWGGGNLIHILLAIVVVLLLVRLL
jgi:hypothetical protein